MENDNQPEWGKTCSKCFIIPQRYIFGVMGFFAIFNAYTMRICLSVVITQLVVARNYTKDKLQDEVICPVLEYDDGKFLPGGYVFSQIPGGVLAQRIGAKIVLTVGILSTALCSIATPWTIVHFDAIGLICLRIIMGFGEGPTFPALACLLSQWVPVTEMGFIGAIVLGGGQIGTIVGNTICGLILAHFTWDNVFYVFGFTSILWCILFVILCYNDPASHPFIKPSEKEYLRSIMGEISRRQDLPPTPWSSIFSGAPIYALICAQIGHDWSFFVMSTDLPKYFNDVIQLPIDKNGFFSSLPFGVMWVSSIMSGYITDHIIRRGAVGITKIRKINTFIASMGPSIFLVLASYSGCNRFHVLACFTIGMGLMGPYYAGMKLSPMDMTRNYSATIMGIVNGVGSLTGVVAPATVGLMTPNTTIDEWRLVFWVAFIMLVISSVVFVIWGTGERQYWDDPEKIAERKQNKT
ncbi:putative inorganic phosphate cotransporter isoform X2 [Teleopsis dalmanni]|uniref:putative inorganic phosphate cotransporter isoform X2 n=1 Tax=Teleopsis dalmanni TaxID=139649 RepID=UPI0018CE5491|nr:putative inorganic phosphate cotransporter isoform X2 [Teleopsis dalmanni]